MPDCGYSLPRQLQSQIHSSFVSGDFMAVSVGDSSYQSCITGVLNSGITFDESELRNHVGREYYKKLDLFGLSPTYKDQLDAGFRPLTLTGLYKSP